MTDETVQTEATEPVAAVEVEPTAYGQEASESFFQRVEKALDELVSSPAALVDWVRQEVAKVRG